MTRTIVRVTVEAEVMMPEGKTRDHIVAAADQLFYRQGYEHTSFSDIADAVRISRGNFYFHFKSKDEILDAVIGRRLAGTRMMLDTWEVEGKTAANRIKSFIDILIANRSDIKRYGCPVGTLCSELTKLDHAARPRANELLMLFRTWLRRQFMLLGRERDADALAMHLLARSQGVALLASSFHDEEFIRQEVDQMCTWLDACARGDTPNRETNGELETRVGRKGKKRKKGGKAITRAQAHR